MDQTIVTLKEKYSVIEGDLIKLALSGSFDVIAHGCNCFNTQGAGIAKQMAESFGTNTFPMELSGMGDVNKLGQVEVLERLIFSKNEEIQTILVANCYTQYNTGRHIDYLALALCMKKLNIMCKGGHIGLPMIGAGIGGGIWSIIEDIIQNQLKDCNVTIVKYKP